MPFRIRLVAAGALAIVAPLASADSYIFTESQFDPGTWSAPTPFFSNPPVNGESMSVTTDRFIGQDGPVMVQLFTMDIPDGVFNVAFAPVMLTDFVYDPSTEGAIEKFAASIHTLPVMDNPHPHLAGIRMYIEQDGRLFVAKPSDNFQAFHVDDPAQHRNFSGYTAPDFSELIPESGFDLDSHPDFAGGPMQFGFGVSMTSTGLDGAGQVMLAAGFDQVSVRFSTIPAPAGAALLGAAGLLAGRRRRM